MRIPVIKIKEQHGDRITERLVGTSWHDELYVEGGGIYYLDIQGMVGTRYPEESGMTFVTRETDEYEAYPTIEFLTVEEFLSLLKKELEQEAIDEIKMQKWLKEITETVLAESEAKKIVKNYVETVGRICHENESEYLREVKP